MERKATSYVVILIEVGVLDSQPFQIPSQFKYYIWCSEYTINHVKLTSH